MPRFEYQAVTPTGKSRSGSIEASSRADAMQQLLQRGETATSLMLAAKTAAPAIPTASSRVVRQRRTRPTMKRADVATLIRELATALEAGLPLVQALHTIRRQATGKGAPSVLDHLIERVEAGEQLHKAAQDYGPPFDDLIVGMLRAADASGQTSVVLHQLAELLDRSLELRREIVGAAFYPMIVLVLIVLSATVLVTVLIPSLLEPLQAAGVTELPMPTEILLGIADLIKNWWLAVIAAVIAAVAGWRFWVAAPENRLKWDSMKLRLPLAGRLNRDVAVARFTRTMGTLAAAGLPLLDCLRITRDTLANAAMMSAIDEVQAQVTQGKPLADPLERSGLFPPLLIQVVNLGERSGRLEEMLGHAATAFDRQVNASIKVFTKAFPPLLIVIMAALGGFVMVAILLPLLDLQKIAG
ncbi:MAG: type II secretion system F family protein [Phycisphaerales bacterium]|nr:type II secretion system F family protein [Phycisphaerales bacterium]